MAAVFVSSSYYLQKLNAEWKIPIVDVFIPNETVGLTHTHTHIYKLGEIITNHPWKECESELETYIKSNEWLSTVAPHFAVVVHEHSAVCAVWGVSIITPEGIDYHVTLSMPIHMNGTVIYNARYLNVLMKNYMQVNTNYDLYEWAIIWYYCSWKFGKLMYDTK